jgi:hypothetical protein
MSFATYSALRSSIKDWAERDSLSDDLVKDFVVLTESVFNYGDDPNGVKPLRVRDMETTATVTMTSGVGDLPTDFLEAIKVKDPGSVTRDIQYATPDWLDENYPTGQDETYPTFYTIIGSQLVCPIDVSLTYYAKIETVTGNDGAVNWLLTKAPNAYLYGGLMHYSIYSKNPEAAVGYRAMMIGALFGLQAQDVQSIAGRFARRAGMVAF